MSHDEQNKSSLGEAGHSDLIPDPMPNERTSDVGEAGQHAPGGYYNQQNVARPDDRIDLDEQARGATESKK